MTPRLPLLALCFTLMGFLPVSAVDQSVDPVLTSPGRDALAPAEVLRPIPPEYGDDRRFFQGIPSMALAPDGRVWVNWYAGGETEGDENYVLLATSGDRGQTWSKPILAIDIPGPVRAYDPAMWTDPEGKVWLFWAQSEKWWDGRGGVWYMIAENPGDPDTAWSSPRRLCDGIMLCKPIVDSKGRWLLPVSLWAREPVHPDRKLPVGANVVVSEDRGNTWKYLGHTLVPPKEATFDEHMLFERNDGALGMWIRTKQGISESLSVDGGRTWSEPMPSTVRHPSARFFLRRLASGRLLLVKHGPIDVRTERSHLTAYLSEDDGKNWKGGLLLDARKGVSYPDGDQDKGGTIYVIYDYSRTQAKEILMARFTEEDILAGKIVSSVGALELPVNKSTAVTPPKPLKFRAETNADGRPLLSGAAAELEFHPGHASVEKTEQGLFKEGEKLFLDREYTMNTSPKEFEGKRFVRSSIRGVHVTCKTPGIVSVFTPTTKRNKDSVAEVLLRQGFEKAALPEFLLFGTSLGNITTLYQKRLETGETVRFGQWGILVY